MTKYKITTEVDTELKLGTVTGVEEIIEPPPPPPPSPPMIDLSIDKIQMEEGQTATLSWTSQNAMKVTINGLDKPLIGSETISPSIGITEYVGIAFGDAIFSSVTDMVSIEVTAKIPDIPPEPPPSDAPTLQLFLDPPSIEIGGTSKLSWVTTNAISLTINGLPTKVNGYSTILSPSTSRTWNFIAMGNGGMVSKSITLTVIGTVPIPEPGPTPPPEPSPEPQPYPISGPVLDDRNLYLPPNVPRPAKGEIYIDPCFHTEIVRITDAPIDVLGQKHNYAQCGYPKHDIENADGTKLLIQSLSNPGWQVWDANPPYNKISSIIYSPGSSGQAIDYRWDSVDPNIGYFEYGGKFWKYDISTNQPTMLHDFRDEFPDPALTYCTMQEEGTSSNDSRYWAFMLKYYDATHSPTWWNHAYVVYDKDFFKKDNGKIISTILENNPLFRICGDIGMSPSGNYVVLGNTHFIYPRDFSSVRVGLLTPGHSDLAYSKEGREVMFGFKWRGSALGGYWAAMEDIETGELTWLAPIGLPRYHFSGNAHEKKGWGLISTYQPKYPDPETVWGDHEVFMVELTKRTNPAPRVWRLAHTHTVRKDYADAPFAKINRRGTKIWFGSGWNQSYLDAGAQYDVYQINLPEGWYEDLG